MTTSEVLAWTLVGMGAMFAFVMWRWQEMMFRAFRAELALNILKRRVPKKYLIKYGLSKATNPKEDRSK